MRPAILTVSQLLRGVSRSFGLSIQLLPARVREPVALAYLLARMTDTVADTASLPARQRLALLDQLLLAMDGTLPAPQLLHPLNDFARHVQDPHEQALLKQGVACLQALHQQTQTDQRSMRQVLKAITDGQRWDLSALDDSGRGVKTRQELDRYTWLVAGSVGEFWTQTCEAHLKNWRNADTHQMMQWGAQYGQGLQRLNILRDAGRDLRAGRCYWPEEELAPLGLDREQLCQAVRTGELSTLEKLAPLLVTWHQITQQQLLAGLHYSLGLRGWRLRLASALPCLIGIHTLGLLRQSGTHAFLEHVKLPRRTVQRLLLGLVVSGVSTRQLTACWTAALSTTEEAFESARIAP